MVHIKNILHKYLCQDAIYVCELCEKADDFVWLEKMGYYDRKTGKETIAGKEYTKKHNALLTKHYSKINDNSLDIKNLMMLAQEIRRYIAKNPKADIYRGLTESEVFTLRYVQRK